MALICFVVAVLLLFLQASDLDALSLCRKRSPHYDRSSITVMPRRTNSSGIAASTGDLMASGRSLIPRYAVLVAVSLTACGRSSRLSPVAECREEKGVRIVPTSSQLQSLVGEFTLLQVTTSDHSNHVSRSRFTLEFPDSARRQRAMVRSIGRVTRTDLQLVGAWKWDPKAPREEVEMDAGTLYLGCRDCTDASPYHLWITKITPRSFSGTWMDYQTGIVYSVNQLGERLPDPAGYFCAIRRD